MHPIEYAARQCGITEEDKIKEMIKDFEKKQQEAEEANRKKNEEEQAKQSMETKKLEALVETILIQLLENPTPNVSRSLMNSFKTFWQKLPLWQIQKKLEKANTHAPNSGRYNNNGDGRFNGDGGCGNSGSHGHRGSGSGGCSNNRVNQN